MRKLFYEIRAWWRRQFHDPYTVACDLSPFWAPHNEREQLSHVKGLWRARALANRWVGAHYWGQARILEGHHEWPKKVEGARG